MVVNSPPKAESPNEAAKSAGSEDTPDGKKLPAARRRTKTGCLTCRRRRIKCGEERPVCKNCVKSKRECAGYVQPLVYKQQQQPHNTFQDHRTAFLQQQAPGPSYQHFQTHNSDHFDTTQPYHHTDFAHASSATVIPPPTLPWAWPALPTSRALAEQLQWPENEFDWSELQQSKHHPQLHINTEVIPGLIPSQVQYSAVSYDPTRRPSEAFTEGTNSTGPDSACRSTASTPFRRHASATDSAFPPHVLSTTDAQKAYDSARMYNVTYDQPQQIRQTSGLPMHDERPPQYDHHGFLQRKSLTQAQKQTSIDMTQSAGDLKDIEDPDDPFDVEDDDAAPEEFEDYAGDDAMRLLQQHKQSRGYYANTLVHHRKPTVVSPLLDEKYQHYFNHFVSYLVPCISIFERPTNVAINGLVKSTWGLYLPSAALSRSALAHAILAMSALHLSALKGSNEDAAIKHFTYALRRLGKLLAMPNRRHEAGTLATVLLLAFYEVISGDHSRWIMHLSGAGSFLMEHDFSAMTRAVRRMRTRARKNIQQPWVVNGSPLSHNDYVRIADIPEALLHDDEWDVDSELSSRLTGLNIDYDKQNQRDNDIGDAHELTDEEVEDWKVKMDLYWWYCKMDIYHSALSGDPLLMSYEQWKYCPPRGPLGKSAVVCATTDHLLLILARLTNFGGEDLKRKQDVVAANGGHWIPAPGFLAPSKHQATDHTVPPLEQPAATEVSSEGVPKAQQELQNLPPSANESRARKSRTSESSAPPQSSKPPPFYGMMPPPSGILHMHSSFHIMDAQLRPESQQKSSAGSTTDQSSTSAVRTQKALAEHAAITQAFEIWANALGSDFEPLPDTPETTVRTPFGPALRYASPLIACTWALYYMGKILLRRLHPHSPPAAMMSAGVNAQFTRDSAQIIGRIVGGLHAELQKASQHGRFDPNAIAATQETTFPLMFAAVQYQDAGQRGWTINKLRDVAEGSGWKSSTAVASACETTWNEMGKSGKGPPYEKTLDHRHVGVRAMGRHHPQRNPIPASGSEAEKSYQSQYVSHDRNLIDRHASTRAFWAIGVLSVEEDMEKLTLKP